MKLNKPSKISQNLSSNTLFHFTKNIDNVKDILKNGFRVSEVVETLPGAKKSEKMYYSAPMVCFCDIPLSGIKLHIQKFGDYGLGIHKNICKQENINPVFYIHNYKVLDSILPKSSEQPNPIIAYIKKYRELEFRRYDEREWRYVKSSEIRIYDKRSLDLKESLRTEGCFLKPGLEKIEYIIVRNKNEITEMIDFIDEGLKISEEMKKILYTKIISATRIKNDF